MIQGGGTRNARELRCGMKWHDARTLDIVPTHPTGLTASEGGLDGRKLRLVVRREEVAVVRRSSTSLAGGRERGTSCDSVHFSHSSMYYFHGFHNCMGRFDSAHAYVTVWQKNNLQHLG